jgi:hypothetical protein
MELKGWVAMQLNFFIVAESLSIDQSTNFASAFNIFEEIKVVGFPTIIPSMQILSTWVRDEGEEEQDCQCLLRITRPGNESPEEFPTNFRSSAPRHRTIHRLQGMPLEHAGNLQFEILLNGTTVKQYTIPVTQADSNPVQNAG